MNNEPVVFDITLSIEELTSSLSKQQEDKVGVKYAYCSCGAAVRASTAHRARKAGRVPQCRSCHLAARRATEAAKDTRVFLCKICRTPLRGDQERAARKNSKRGSGTCCSDLACKKANRQEKLVIMRAAVAVKRGPILHPPCVKCGLPAVANKARRAKVRLGKRKALCKGCRRPWGRPPSVK